MTSTLDHQGILCPHCRHTFTIPESDVSLGGGGVVHVVSGGSVFRCPSCGNLFSLKDTQAPSYWGVDIIYVASALLVGLGFGFALLSLLGLNLPFAFTGKG